MGPVSRFTFQIEKGHITQLLRNRSRLHLAEQAPHTAGWLFGLGDKQLRSVTAAALTLRQGLDPLYL